MVMSKNDINQNGIKYNVSRNILFGILAGIITAIGITGISNVSAQGMNSLLLLLLLMTHHKCRRK